MDAFRLARAAAAVALRIAATAWLHRTLTVGLTVVGLVLPAAAGCQLEARARRTPLLADDGAATTSEIERGEIETGRLRTADADVYQPSFRILDLPDGRVRLIVQDPLTHHYRVVGSY